jgi:hypothetical protein
MPEMHPCSMGIPDVPGAPVRVQSTPTSKIFFEPPLTGHEQSLTRPLAIPPPVLQGPKNRPSKAHLSQKTKGIFEVCLLAVPVMKSHRVMR